MKQCKVLSNALAALAAAVAVVALVGPLVTSLVDYRYTETMLNQGTGLDAFALLFVVPVTLFAAVLSRQQHPAAPLVALGPSAFVLYMSVQYVIGPEYLLVDGNGERAFPLFLGVFVLSGFALVQAWAAADAPRWAERAMRRRGIALLLIAAFVVLVMYLANGFLAAIWDFPAYAAERAAVSEYDEHPTAYWIVAFLDLGVVVPLTVATGIGLLRRRGWARRAFYGVVGWYGLVPPSVAAMAITMVARDDPAADTGRAVVLTVAAAVLSTFAVRVFLPLLRPATALRASARDAGGRRRAGPVPEVPAQAPVRSTTGGRGRTRRAASSGRRRQGPPGQGVR